MSALKVVERLEGDATTDFGAPGAPPASDGLPLDASEAKRQASLLKAAWAMLNRAAEAADGISLRKGPRGGGRDLDAIVRHVRDAEKAYLSRLGGSYRSNAAENTTAEGALLRAAILDTFSARARGEPPPETGRRRTFWSPRFFVRRTAWHALDHAWEIEDRAG